MTTTLYRAVLVPEAKPYSDGISLGIGEGIFKIYRTEELEAKLGHVGGGSGTDGKKWMILETDLSEEEIAAHPLVASVEVSEDD
jgi:hypothetical protein